MFCWICALTLVVLSYKPNQNYVITEGLLGPATHDPKLLETMGNTQLSVTKTDNCFDHCDILLLIIKNYVIILS